MGRATLRMLKFTPAVPPKDLYPAYVTIFKIRNRLDILLATDMCAYDSARKR
jgi:hypothetical protein